jgi:hypothetical protein
MRGSTDYLIGVEIEFDEHSGTVSVGNYFSGSDTRYTYRELYSFRAY